ncbi:LysR family transcriptional regulator [Caldinitratiruptor microaerophilus]|uniref:LysR family transcriptional regulator n=1 Tax=Caldinitratiruptor microaerophilus TaxID=671077 RepID=A0AA35CHP1_9FIRM|nr:LysR family transcriptional regulator [Caldinitratiruptor microaerophilus]BDG59174.1 LysR family transcriptional regulator [Caldinitratiruptor microaerophilus]
MKLRQLEVFCKVFECRGVTRAADALFMTQPAVSLQIRALERSLGVKLFEHRAGSMVPTPAGEILYRYASAIRDLHTVAQSSLEQYRHGYHGRILLGVATGVLYLLPPFLKQYRKAVPGVEITLHSANSDRVREDVARGTHDIGLVWGPVADDRLECEVVARTEFCVIVPCDHELAETDEVSPERLSQYPFVLGAEGTATRNFVEAKLREAGIIPRVVAGLSTTEAMKRAVESQIGLTVLSREAVQYEIQAGVLKPIRISGVSIHRDVVLVQANRRIKPSAVVRFVSAVRSHPMFVQSRVT